MIFDYLNAVVLILFAEMGDKTQFLAMAFATKYPVRKILLGIGIGSFLNHGLAILFGKALLGLIPVKMISVIAGLMFLFFAFSSLKVDDDTEETGKDKHGPILTVALAFFIGELGDKTQLSALGLSVNASYPMLTLAGTVTGMILTSLIGIYIGLKLGKKIPEDKLKIAACIAFIAFGYQKLYQAYLVDVHMVFALAIALLLLISAIFFIRRYQLQYKLAGETKFASQAEMLKQVKSKIEFNVNMLCHGTDVCGDCDGKACLVGYMKHVLSNADTPITEESAKRIAGLKNKIYDVNEGREILKILIDYYDHYPEEFNNNDQLTILRRTAEFIVFDKILFTDDLNKYKKFVESN